MYNMDDTDYAILEILKDNGRASYSEIAEKVSLSRVSVRERINNMIENGIIHGFTVVIDAKSYQKFAGVFMDIETEPDKIDYVAHELMKLKDVAVVSQHTGTTGLHVHAYIESVEKLSSYMEKNIYSIKGVKGAQVQLLIHQYKTNSYLARYQE